MWLVVPHDSGRLAALEESLDSRDLTGLGIIAQQGFVDLTMPKWGTDPAAHRSFRVALSSGVLSRSAS